MKQYDLIFDIDGTIWDSCEAVRDSWRVSLRKRYGCFGSPSLEQVRSIMGKTPDEIAQLLFSRFGSNARAVFDALSEDECAYLAANGAALYPGVPETLRALSGQHRLFLVSNCQAGYVEALYAATGLGSCFEDARCAGVTGLDKAGNLRALIRDRALENTFYIGDTEGDERAAREAGCGFIHAVYGFGSAKAPDAVLHSFSELPALIRTLEEEHDHV